MERPASFDARLDLIPEEPGVYLMKDADGTVIYVGKAIQLPRRLRSYFVPNPKGDARILAMISHIRDFEYVLCANELEALVLENNLIKQYRPRYNILLRDDKEYPYIKVTKNEAYPRVMKSFHIEEDYKEGVQYYGPYQSGDLQRALKAIYDIFPLKRCRRVLPRDIGKERPCLNYYIGKCVGPCLGSVSEADYRAVIEELCSFLDGKSVPFSQKLEEEMHGAAEIMDFERAARLRDRLYALQKLNERQVIVNADLKGEADVLGAAENGSEKAIQILKIREGRIISSGSFFFPDRGEEKAEVYRSFIEQYYSLGHSLPKEIILSEIPTNGRQIEHWLSGLRGTKVSLHRPERGLKKRWLEMGERNAGESLLRHTLVGGGYGDRERTLEDLRERLALAEYPRRIEAYDIANLGGVDKAASMVVFIDGKPKRSLYRHFRIKSVEGQDDYASMNEVLERRLKNLSDKEFGEKPQLILIDGGLGHLSAVRSQFTGQGADIGLAAMVKDSKHRSRGLVTMEGKEINLRHSREEEDEMAPASRHKDLALLRLVTAIQNEAHRFAGRLQKNLSKKRNLRWNLESIPGVGPTRRKQLLKEFKTLKAISEASLDQLKAVRGLPEKTAEAVYRHFSERQAGENK